MNRKKPRILYRGRLPSATHASLVSSFPLLFWQFCFCWLWHFQSFLWLFFFTMAMPMETGIFWQHFQNMKKLSRILQTTRDFIHHTWFSDALKNYKCRHHQKKQVHPWFFFSWKFFPPNNLLIEWKSSVNNLIVYVFEQKIYKIFQLKLPSPFCKTLLKKIFRVVFSSKVVPIYIYWICVVT